MMDNRCQYGAMGYEGMGFTNPWGERAQAQAASQIYQIQATNSGMQGQQPLSRQSSISMPYATSATTSSISPGMHIPTWSISEEQELMTAVLEMMQPPRPYGTDFAPVATTHQSYAPTSTARYSPEYAQSLASYGYDDGSRRASYQYVLYLYYSCSSISNTTLQI